MSQMTSIQSDSSLILEAKDSCKSFHSRDRQVTRALNHVNLKIYSGEVLALIGESGSGKSTLGRALLRLLKLDQGDVIWQGHSIMQLRGSQLRAFRQKFQMIFQNQQANLHPRMSVEQMLNESLCLHRPHLTPEERQDKITSLLQQVELKNYHQRYMASLSGGEQRRIGLARILATQPTLIIADEPTSGLDAAIKLQMIDLLNSIKGSDLTYLLISHDLNLVRKIADRVLVMLRGNIIEEVRIQDLGKVRHHPYTEKLLAAAELGDRTLEFATSSIEDLQTTHINACPYAYLCPWMNESLKQKCFHSMPTMSVTDPTTQHQVACWKLQQDMVSHPQTQASLPTHTQVNQIHPLQEDHSLLSSPEAYVNEHENHNEA